VATDWPNFYKVLEGSGNSLANFLQGIRGQWQLTGQFFGQFFTRFQRAMATLWQSPRRVLTIFAIFVRGLPIPSDPLPNDNVYPPEQLSDDIG
jgi:hypothetical protein